MVIIHLYNQNKYIKCVSNYVYLLAFMDQNYTYLYVFIYYHLQPLFYYTQIYVHYNKKEFNVNTSVMHIYTYTGHL